MRDLVCGDDAVEGNLAADDVEVEEGVGASEDFDFDLRADLAAEIVENLLVCEGCILAGEILAIDLDDAVAREDAESGARASGDD